MAQAGDWQRDVLRELGQGAGSRAAGEGHGHGAEADDGSGGAPAPPARRAEPTLRLVRSAPAGQAEQAEPTEQAEQAGPSEQAGGGPPVRPTPVRQVPVQQHVVQPPVQPGPAVPLPVQPVVPAPMVPTPVVPAPVVPTPVVPTPVVPAADPRTEHPRTAAQMPGASPGDPARPGVPAPPDRPGDDPRSDHAAPAPRGSRTPQTPMRAPDSVPTIDPRLAHALGRPQHGDSVARRTGRSIRKLTSSAAQDVAEETRIARELQQPVTTGRVIAVTSIRGGVGKSTTAALLGRTFNHYRHDPVLTMEADAALGTLPVRMGADSVRWAAADLARILNPAMQLTDVTGYLVPVSDGGWLLPGSQGRVGAPLDIRTYRTVTLALRRYFAVTVVDCETLPGEVARTAMDTAHARVVVAPMTAEGVNGTRQVLDWLGRLPHSALASTVVALTANSPDVTLDRKAAVAHLKESGVHVVTVPYDRHLAQGGPIRTALLGQETRDAAITLAAEAMTRAVRMR